MNGAECLLRTAASAGVEICFANPGTTEMPLVAALDAVQEVRAVLGLFEGVCTGAADGYGRMTGSPALTLLHLGPGFANGIANLHNARRARTPIVNLIGDHASWHLEYDAPLTSDIVSLAEPVSGWVRTVTSANRMADDTAEAIAAASEPEGQVATLILPADFQAEETSGLVEIRPSVGPSEIDPRRIETVARRLREASNPVVMLGGNALSLACQKAAARIAHVTGARLLAETFPARWERGIGTPSVDRLAYFPEQAIAELGDVDCLVIAGGIPPVAFFGYEGIQSELWAAGSLELLCCPGDDTLLALDSVAASLDAPLRVELPSRAPIPEPTGNELNPGSVGGILARQLPENAIVIDEAATSGLPFVLAASASAPHTLLSLTGGAIGQGLPCAVGAAIACPDRKVIAFQADGSAAYTSQALWTMAREGLDVVVLLCSNRAYRILQIELARAGAAEPGAKARALTQLDRPPLDWCALAKGYGVPACRVEKADEFARELGRALGEAGPQLLELVL